ncbi:MAG: SH3 type 3 domain-containing protein [Rhodospirillaceae bacterium]|nr:MAG: SH3 type 3 domain-containing protein [Rhodospirillaceae bacterium]
MLEGFDVPAATAGGGEGSRQAPISGTLTTSAAYNFNRDAASVDHHNYRGLSRLRLKLGLEMDVEPAPDWQTHASGHAFYDAFYALRGREDFPGATLEAMERSIEPGEAWLRGRLGSWGDLKLGRQIMVWGRSDTLRVTDVLNPLDNREPGLTDIEDVRLPLTMARIDFYAGSWNLSALAIGEIRFNENPPFGADFATRATPPPAESIPSSFGSNTEHALALNGIFSRLDLSFYWAMVHNDQPYQTTFPFAMRHAWLSMAGFAGNMTHGNWLLKTELARFDGLRLNGATTAQRRTDLLLGLEYSGVPDQTVSVEVVNRHLHGTVPAGNQENRIQTAVRYQGNFHHGRLHAVVLNTTNGPGGGGFLRASLAYDVRDALTLTGGVMVFHGGDLDDRDRIFAEMKYSF